MKRLTQEDIINLIKSKVENSDIHYVDWKKETIVSPKTGREKTYEYLVFDVQEELFDTDFECYYDDDPPHFSGGVCCYYAKLKLLKRFIESGIAKLYGLKVHEYKVADSSFFELADSDEYFIEVVDRQLFETDDEYFNKYYEDEIPSIKIYYQPMVVRGIMDADPEEYDYETEPHDITVRINVYIEHRSYVHFKCAMWRR